MPGDFEAKLVTLCTANKGSVKVHDFQAAVSQTAIEASLQSSTRHVAKSIDVLIEAGRHDPNLDVKAAVYVVDRLLKSEAIRCEESNTTGKQGTGPTRWTQTFSPYFMRWLQRCIVYQRSDRGLQTMQVLVVSWQRKNFLSAQDAEQLLNLLMKVQKRETRRRASAHTPDSLQISEDSQSQAANIAAQPILQNSSCEKRPQAKIDSPEKIEGGKLRQASVDSQDSLQSSQASGSCAPEACDADSQASTEASLQDERPRFKRLRGSSSSEKVSSVSLTSHSNSQPLDGIIHESSSPASLSTATNMGALNTSSESVAKRLRCNSSCELNGTLAEVTGSVRETANSSEGSPVPMCNRSSSGNQVIAEISKFGRISDKKPTSQCPSTPKSIQKQSDGQVNARLSSPEEVAKQEAKAATLSTPTRAQTLIPRTSSCQSGATSVLPAQGNKSKESATGVATEAIPQIWKVGGDHRCLFRAICRACNDPLNEIKRDAKGLPRAEKARQKELMRADDLRAQVCVTMAKFASEVDSLLGGEMEVEEYIRRMGEWQTWGDGICLHFLPDIVRRPIQVYALNTATKSVFDSGMHLPKEKGLHGEPPIVLWYNGKSHYDLISTHWLKARERSLLSSETTSS